MVDIFDELLDIREIEKFPSRIAKFIHRTGETQSHENSWSYHSFVYGKAFEILARNALQSWRDEHNLTNPLIYLARHSIELELKNAILEYARTDDSAPEIAGWLDAVVESTCKLHGTMGGPSDRRLG